MLASSKNNESLKSELNRLTKKITAETKDLLGLTITLFDKNTQKVGSFFRSEYFDRKIPVISTPLHASSVLMTLKHNLQNIVINQITTENQSILNILKSVSKKQTDNSVNYSILCIPIHQSNQFIGSIFLLAKQSHYFQGIHLTLCEAYGTLIAQIIINYLNRIGEFSRVLKATLTISHHRDPETLNHLKRMREYSKLIARHLYQKGLCDDLLSTQIAKYADMHDIGKYRIPDEILFSTERFTDEQRKIMSTHPELGVEMLNEILTIFHLNRSDDVQILTNIILHHHERYDGKGYPHQLKGKNIPLEARIVAAADVLDALLSPRAYKRAWSLTEVLVYFKSEMNRHFDPDCVEAVCLNQSAILDIQKNYQDA